MDQHERYLAWSQASINAFVDRDVDMQVSLWNKACTRTAIDAFGDDNTVQGREALRKMAQKWATVDSLRLLKNELLSATEEQGIGNALVRWKEGEGKEYACNSIYIVTLDDEDRCVSYTEWNVVKSRERENRFNGRGFNSKRA